MDEDIKREGSDPFAELEKETPPESHSGKELEKETEQVPFHKDPRWVKREEELEELRASKEATAREIAELREMASKPSDPNVQIPEWFKELYGENKVAWEKYAQREWQREQEIEHRVLERQNQQQQAVVAETQHWSKWVDNEISKLETEGNVFDRNKLIKTMLDYRPTDENNNFDFKAGFKIYQALEGSPDPAKSQARKELADRTTSSTKGEPAKKDYMTSAELRRKSWSNL